MLAFYRAAFRGMDVGCQIECYAFLNLACKLSLLRYILRDLQASPLELP
jgi:hypothetical protein